MRENWLYCQQFTTMTSITAIAGNSYTVVVPATTFEFARPIILKAIKSTQIVKNVTNNRWTHANLTYTFTQYNLFKDGTEIDLLFSNTGIIYTPNHQNVPFELGENVIIDSITLSAQNQVWTVLANALGAANTAYLYTSLWWQPYKNDKIVKGQNT